MPFGWSFYVGIVGVVLIIPTAICYMLEVISQLARDSYQPMIEHVVGLT